MRRIQKTSRIDSIPYYRQETPYTCGAAALRMALAWCGIRKTEKQTAALLAGHAPRTKRVKDFLFRAAANKQFPAVAEFFKLNYAVRRNASLREVQSRLRDGYAVIVGYFLVDVGHYAIVKSIRAKHILLMDPEEGPRCRYTLNYFMRVWRNDPRDDNEKRWCIAMKR